MSNKYLLTFDERKKIEYYLRLKLSKRNIANRLNRNSSVIIREVNRNKSPDGIYRAKEAQKMADQKASRTNKRKLDTNTALLKYVEGQLQEGLSPEQIAGILKNNPPFHLKDQYLNHESIYQYIYDTPYGKHMYKYLRRGRDKRQGHGKRKKQAQNSIKERISIHERPIEIDEKKNYGHWESDLMEFKKQKERLSVQYERKSMMVHLKKVLDKSAKEKYEALVDAVENVSPQLCKSFTFDNGSENAWHIKLKKEWNIMTYFCDAYAAWQKGGVENVNGLIRQYLPKNTDFSKITDREIYEIQKRLNNRPRKSLGWLSPNEIIAKEFGIKGDALNS